ncbi:MAG: Bifunctional xylanase/deacetylase precursor [Microbacteriaceae bacterium]|jgi:peptidoglycan/xylan/chitin deacetylase (PgdA/CDA1 family)|nr:Bifunctional xylanase/deacetylase precursor [Microbacteriaceae bacterium]
MTLATGVLVAGGSVVAGAAESGEFAPPPLARPVSGPSFVPRPTPAHPAEPIALPRRFSPPRLTKVPLRHGAIYGLPGPGNSVALTVDDGASSEVVKLYAEFARRTGMRITFFLNGSRPSWTDNAPALRPLVESGQVQLANHTWSHPDLRTLSDAGIVNELGKNHDFIRNVYGLDARPYFRPPFGYHNPRVDAAATGIGYSTPVLWYGSLSDSGLITPDQLKSFADRWMLAQRIVIGHANFLPVTDCFDYLVDLIHSRNLQPVTLNDYFAH